MSRPLLMCACAYAALIGADAHSADALRGQFQRPLRIVVPFTPGKDFAPIMQVSNSPGVLAVHASLPVRNVKELVQLAKGKPGQITFGSAGVASNSHLSGELFKVLAGVDIIHVPYKGSSPAMNRTGTHATSPGPRREKSHHGFRQDRASLQRRH